MSGEKRIPAMVFPPGMFVEEELEARGLDKMLMVRSEFRQGDRPLERKQAEALGTMFGVSISYWMLLDKAWREAKELEAKK